MEKDSELQELKTLKRDIEDIIVSIKLRSFIDAKQCFLSLKSKIDNSSFIMHHLNTFISQFPDDGKLSSFAYTQEYLCNADDIEHGNGYYAVICHQYYGLSYLITNTYDNCYEKLEPYNFIRNLTTYIIQELEKDINIRSEQIMINNTFSPINNYNPTITQTQENNQTQNTNISITIDQVFEAIKQIPDEILSKENKDELEDKLSAVETAKNSKDKGKLASKIGAVLKYIIDKGIEVGIAVLPYLGEIAKLYSGM